MLVKNVRLSTFLLVYSSEYIHGTDALRQLLVVRKDATKAVVDKLDLGLWSIVHEQNVLVFLWSGEGARVVEKGVSSKHLAARNTNP